MKHLVSKEKRRFSSDGFDLDLTYVTQKLVAFGYPAEKIEGIYRNHYRDVFRFFEQRHPDRYRVYNLCVERRYAPGEKFHGRVAEFGFEDHTPPPLSMMIPFCLDVHAWLQADPENVVAVHCKAGKGRTGVMLCAYMLYTRMWRSAHGALEYFAAARSMKLQGVTIISQQRFIGYFAEMCRRSESIEDVELLGSYEEEVTPGHKKTNTSAADWRVRVECGAIRPRAAVYDLPGNFQRQRRPRAEGNTDEEVVELELHCNRVLVWDEVKVELRRRAGGTLGHFWFHTAFVPQVGDHFELTLAKSEIDKVAKDAKHGHKKFAPEFAVRLHFEAGTSQDLAKSPSEAAT
ncbi:Phosphatidylinositol-3,4,5-trisphosphate 3-phosphatase [Phytophthora cinnamomi]|uniref:Phosphatidylinositol-3,4,5-trisphosphate 3-phosphatase n=1 Tax=Phytophthora cinnamomi TaxID=4785 RepID=UPI00355A22E6|nr:Phosphatidylinositol-3,4,5-trisphosphate 3-phosphatase [Phytophthora cinnamomi]